MTTNPLPIPQPDGLNDAKGQTTQTGYRYFQSLDKSARANAETLSTLASRPAPDIGVAIAFVENQNYRMDQKASVAYTIDEVVSICDSGTCTATVYIDGVAITATANSVSTSEQTRTPTAANSVAVGSDVRVTITSNSSCEGALIKCKCSYT